MSWLQTSRPQSRGQCEAQSRSEQVKIKKKKQPPAPWPRSPPPSFPAGSGTAGTEGRSRPQPLNAAFVFVCSRFLQEASNSHPFTSLSPSALLCESAAKPFRKHRFGLFNLFVCLLFFLKGNVLKTLLFCQKGRSW